MWGRARRPRRKVVILRPIIAPATLATDLYRAAYLPVVELWQNALAPIEAEYRRSLAALTADSPADLGAQLDQTDGEFLRLVQTLRLRLDQWTLRVEGWQRGKWRGAVLSATGVDIGTMIGPQDVRETLAAAIERNVALIKSVSDEARARIADAVFRGLNQRRPADEVAKDIQGYVGMAQDRARRIAADQIVKLGSSLAAERRREAGIDVWMWRHSAKRHPREWHLARNGVLYSENPAMQGREVNGQVVHKPPQATDLPGQPPFCGCVEQAVLVLD